MTAGNPRLFSAVLLLAAPCFGPRLAAQTPEVGSGPVSSTIRQEFQRSYFRNGFHLLVSLPPLGDVKRFGPTGLVQEFPDAAKTAGVRYALIKATTSDVILEGVETVFQAQPSMYSYYSGVGPMTAGYPNTDTQSCGSVAGNACLFQLFDKNYALFVYSQPTLAGQNFTVKDPFFSRWSTLGGVSGIGPAVGAEETVTSGAVTAITQRFSAGALYTITSGALNGRLFAVKQPVFDLYVANSAHLGFLGLPTADEIMLPNARRRQTFEGGAIEYEQGQTPALRLPVASITVTASASSERLNLGDTVTLQAAAFAGNGALLEGRAIAWSSTNTRVVTVDPSGSVVTLRAVGGGTANVTAVSEGKSSRSLTYFVVAPCCQIGEGAPTAAIQQAFADAATRNRLAVKLPASNPVRRAGAGFIHELVPVDPESAARYVLAKPDTQSNAFLVTGAYLARWTELGGPTGTLGYPTADVTPGGRQQFQSGALAGGAAYLVSGGILTRWAALRYEAGPAGLPAGSAETVLSFAATLASAQLFSNGLFVAHGSGPLVNRVFLVSGLILARYNSTGGPAGSMGLPVGDEFVSSGRRRQDFEGGIIDYAPGDPEARLDQRERRPQISANPSTVAAGTRIRIAAGGFSNGATLRIKVGDQPDFTVPTQTGAFAWEMFVAPNTPSGLVNLRAAEVNGTGLAVGSFLVQSSPETLMRLTKVRGDGQTGLPGARLPLALRVQVRDEFGSAVSGVAVRFESSPGAAIEEPQAVTDERGEAQAWLRLPFSETPGLAIARAGGQVVTFSARSAASSIANFPRFSQAGQTGATQLGNEPSTIARSGALLTAAAAIVRHLQNSAETGAPNGQADPLTLNQYLRDVCVFDPQGERICDGFLAPPDASERNINLWRLANFTGGNLDLAPVEVRPDRIRDTLAQGSPVLLALALVSGETLLGSHFVVAIGVTSSGAILIHDPNPAWNRSALDEYIAGFQAAGKNYRATLATALRFAGRAASPLGFLVATSADPAISGATGPCGFRASWPDAAATVETPSRVPRTAHFAYCDGQSPVYQLDLDGSGRQRFLVVDLGTTGGRADLDPVLPASFRLQRPGSNWVASVLDLQFGPESVLNGASFTTELSPGVLAAVFGSGLSIPGRLTSIEVDDQAARLVSATPFQLNFQIPDTVAPGVHRLRIQSPVGSQEQMIQLREVSPALFSVAGGRGAVLNQSGTLNSAANPAARGEVVVAYATGLGRLAPRGNLQVVEIPVIATLDGKPLDVLYAGAAPGFPGLYQLNLRLSGDLVPGLAQRLAIEQGGTPSNPVLVAVQ